MELAVELPELRRVVILRDGLERLESRSHDVRLLRRHRLDRPADHLALDDSTQVVEAAEVVEVDARGDRGALRQRDDEPFGLEPADRLADRDMADPEALLQFGDLDTGAGLDLAGQQCTPQPLGHVVDHAHALDRVAAKCFHDQVRRSTRHACFIEYRDALGSALHKAGGGNSCGSRRGRGRSRERRPARLDLVRRLEEPLSRTKNERFAPGWPRELHSDRDFVLVESGAYCTGGKSDEILRRRVAHHEIAEGQLHAIVEDRLVSDRKRELPR